MILNMIKHRWIIIEQIKVDLLLKNKRSQSFHHLLAILGIRMEDMVNMIFSFLFKQLQFPFPATLLHSLIVPNPSIPQTILPSNTNKNLRTTKFSQAKCPRSHRVEHRIIHPTRCIRVHKAPNHIVQALLKPFNRFRSNWLWAQEIWVDINSTCTKNEICNYFLLSCTLIKIWDSKFSK